MSVQLRVDDLALGVRGGDTLVQHVSFELHGGTRTALVGESGSGKSLTVLSIAGLLPSAIEQRSGDIWWRGTSLASCSSARRRSLCGTSIGVVFQEPMTALNPVMTIEAQMLEARRRFTGGAADSAWVSDALGAMGFDDPRRVQQAWPHLLSGGMRQRVLVAMALAANPDVILADEPTTALDALTRSLVLHRLTTEASRGASVLLVTHDLASIEHWADQVIVMRAGHVCECGPAAAVLNDPLHPYTAGLLACTPTLAGTGLVDLRTTVDAAALGRPVAGHGCPWWPGKGGYELIEVGNDRQVGVSREP